MTIFFRRIFLMMSKTKTIEFVSKNNNDLKKIEMFCNEKKQ